MSRELRRTWMIRFPLYVLFTTVISILIGIARGRVIDTPLFVGYLVSACGAGLIWMIGEVLLERRAERRRLQREERLKALEAEGELIFPKNKQGDQ